MRMAGMGTLAWCYWPPWAATAAIEGWPQSVLLRTEPDGLGHFSLHFSTSLLRRHGHWVLVLQRT